MTNKMQLVSEEAKERMKQEWLDLQEKEIEPSLLQLESNKMVTASLVCRWWQGKRFHDDDGARQGCEYLRGYYRP